MRVLAIETSCDDTSCAVVMQDSDGVMRTEHMVSFHQLKLHASYGWVVPELASREHLDKIVSVLYALVDLYNVDIDIFMESIDSIAVTTHPWLPWSLVIGKTAALVLGTFFDKPIEYINHLHGHVFSWMIDRHPRHHNQTLVLSLSGGHSDMYIISDSSLDMDNIDKSSVGSYLLYHIAQTRDDAMGEVFDKVSRLLGWPYPGGAWIEQQASSFTLSPTDGFYKTLIKEYIKFKPIFLWDTLDFSFSWVKSQAQQTIDHIQRFLELDNKKKISSDIVALICYSFQEVMSKILVQRMWQALERYKDVTRVALVGGVSANKKLSADIQDDIDVFNYRYWRNLEFVKPLSFEYCTDNAAMIGAVSLLSQV